MINKFWLKEKVISVNMDHSGLTGIAEVDRIILSELDDNLLSHICSFNKYFFSLCQDDNLWRAKVVKTYGEEVASYKPAHFTFRQQYWDLKKGSVILTYIIRDHRYDKILAYHKYFHSDPTLVLQAIEEGDLPLLKFLDAHGFYIAVTEPSGPGKNGNKELVLWLQNKGFVVDSQLSLSALYYNNLELAEWLWSLGFIPSHMDLMLLRGKNEILDWLTNKGIAIPQDWYARRRRRKN